MPNFFEQKALIIVGTVLGTNLVSSVIALIFPVARCSVNILSSLEKNLVALASGIMIGTVLIMIFPEIMSSQQEVELLQYMIVVCAGVLFSLFLQSWQQYKKYRQLHQLEKNITTNNEVSMREYKKLLKDQQTNNSSIQTVDNDELDDGEDFVVIASEQTSVGLPGTDFGDVDQRFIRTMIYLELLHKLMESAAMVASLKASNETGIWYSIAVLLHQIPHYCGLAGIFKKAGYSFAYSIWFFVAMFFVAIIGGSVGIVLALYAEDATLYILAFSAGTLLFLGFTSLQFSVERQKWGNASYHPSFYVMWIYCFVGVALTTAFKYLGAYIEYEHK